MSLLEFSDIFRTPEGVDYVLVFSEANEFDTENISSKIFRASLYPVDSTALNGVNKKSTLLFFTQKLIDFLRDNPSYILYYYCSSEPIKMNRKRIKLGYTPQQYRNELFAKFYELENDTTSDILQISYKDSVDLHYMSIIYKKEKEDCAMRVHEEIKNFTNNYKV